MARWILLLVSVLAVHGQSHSAVTTRSSTTAEKVTLQHDPASPTRIQVCYIVVNTTVAGTISTAVGGTAATTTEVTPAATSPGGSTARAKVFSTSNVGSGTATSPAMTLTASIPNRFDMKNVFLSGNGTTKNVTWDITVGSSSTVTTGIYWAENGKCEN